jgi:hypothetical protein
MSKDFDPWLLHHESLAYTRRWTDEQIAEFLALGFPTATPNLIRGSYGRTGDEGMSKHKELVDRLRYNAEMFTSRSTEKALMDEAARVIEEQAAEIAELSDVSLSSMRLENGALDMSVVSPMIQRMATAIGGWFKGTNTINYAEMRLHDRVETLEVYTITIQKASGKTPHQLRAEAENKIEKQAAEIERLRNAISDVDGLSMSLYIRKDQMIADIKRRLRAALNPQWQTQEPPPEKPPSDVSS